MATSSYFNNYGSSAEQGVIEDLIVESIKIMGFDAYYLPNDNDQARDLLYGEDPTKKFQSAFIIEMYLSNSTEYMGEKDFFSKFGLEIKNNVNVIVSKRSFSQRVPNANITRPREGDLVFVPVLNGVGELFEIKFSNQNKDYNMLGRKVPYFYELELEKYRYSQEVIDTGVPEIDDIVTNSAYTIDLITDEGTGFYQNKEIVFQSPDNTVANAVATGTVQGWTPSANTLSISNVFGEFSNNMVIIGATSNAQYSLHTFDAIDVNVKNEAYDNKLIETLAASVRDNTDINPFGTI
jgi:hypothetical protein